MNSLGHLMETTATANYDVFTENCPTRALLDRIANRWTTLIIGMLAQRQPRRFNELRRAIGGISQKMLTQTLREMERDGIVRREIFPEVPPRVEYALTPLGHTLREPLNALADWSVRHMDEVRAAQVRFDGAQGTRNAERSAITP
ncbi:MAG TPA: helix-turn-helix domain-containing protein [Candidatus Baltobacteraceae bacterium]|nr:helix-turn-helix domain-containing protein [Candidatus Baltobacteraceae bacterium]